VASALRAAGIPVPDVVADGSVRDLGGDGPGEWIVARRVAGQTMAVAWPGLSGDERNRVGAEVGRLLRILNESRVELGAPAWWRDAHTPALDATPIGGSAILHEARAFVGHRVELVAAEGEVPIHCDAHGFNVMVAEGRVVALLDWEGAHHGPRSTELDMILRHWGNADTFISGPTESPIDMTVDDGIEAVAAIAAGYPELFDGPDVRARLEFHDMYWRLQGALLDHRLNGVALDLDGITHALEGDTHLRHFQGFF